MKIPRHPTKNRGRVSKAMRSEQANAEMRKGWIITSDKDDVTFLPGYFSFDGARKGREKGEQRVGGIGERGGGGGFTILCLGFFFRSHTHKKNLFHTENSWFRTD